MRKLFSNTQPDVCFHLAAQALVLKANRSPVSTLKANIQGTWNILEAVRELSLPTKIVVASSDKAYGEHKKLPYIETAALQALHPYDASKACADILARTYAHTYHMPVAVTRCANIYGPGDLNFSRIIPDAFRSIVLKKNLIIRSDGTPVRDYIFVGDVVDAYLVLAQALSKNAKGVRGEAFNFGTGKPISVLRLVHVIKQITGARELIACIASKGKIKGEIDKQYLCSKKARDLLHWYPRHSLTQGLTKTFQWYSQYLRY
jgi:CDP-glucose 4,6-dehydratase